MRVTFWGVRGSIPIPGDATSRWGGNSSCLEVRHGDLPPLVLDCGTGARALGKKLAREHVRHVHLLLSHLHVDHLFGFPFFLPLYTPGSRVLVGVPAYSDDEARERISRYLNGTFHPVRLRDVPAELTFQSVRPGKKLDCDGYDVDTVRLNHPGGALGYRVGIDGRAFAYITDTAPFARPGEGVSAGEAPTPAERRVVEFLRGVDLVVYDTMYSYDEYLEKMTWGHSYPEYAAALCRAAGVARMVMFHHNPDDDDDVLDARATAWEGHEAPVVTQAREGVTIEV